MKTRTKKPLKKPARRKRQLRINKHIGKKSNRNKIYKVFVFSDTHGVFLDRPAFDCFLQVLKLKKPDLVVGNGDIIDFPLISSHPKKLWGLGEEFLKDYSEKKEINFTIENILKPIRKIAKGAKCIFRCGNHEERVTNAKSASLSQISRLALLEKQMSDEGRGGGLDKFLQLKEIGWSYDPSPAMNLFGKFVITHGVSLAQNAPRENMRRFHKSGTSGHTHRLNSTIQTTPEGEAIGWWESGTLRTKENVEYFPVSTSTPDWCHGFLEIDFVLNSKGKCESFHINPYTIIEGKTVCDGKVIIGKSE